MVFLFEFWNGYSFATEYVLCTVGIVYSSNHEVSFSILKYISDVSCGTCTSAIEDDSCVASVIHAVTFVNHPVAWPEYRNQWEEGIQITYSNPASEKEYFFPNYHMNYSKYFTKSGYVVRNISVCIFRHHMKQVRKRTIFMSYFPLHTIGKRRSYPNVS